MAVACAQQGARPAPHVAATADQATARAVRDAAHAAARATAADGDVAPTADSATAVTVGTVGGSGGSGDGQLGCRLVTTGGGGSDCHTVATWAHAHRPGGAGTGTPAAPSHTNGSVRAPRAAHPDRW